MRRRLHRAELRLSLNRKPLQCAKSTSASSNLIRSHLCIFIAQSVRRDVKAWQGIYIVLLANGDDKIAVSITIHLGVRASISICRALCSSPSVSGVYFAENFIPFCIVGVSCPVEVIHMTTHHAQWWTAVGSLGPRHTKPRNIALPGPSQGSMQVKPWSNATIDVAQNLHDAVGGEAECRPKFGYTISPQVGISKRRSRLEKCSC